ncbi:MAG: DUF4384 domain-containing protein [Akkermansia sp.]|nr:DUF4384 domain-containing protein [Akkermansia sp.]
MLAIIITDSTGYTHYHPLSGGDRSYTIGRSPDCDFSLPEETTLADIHCHLTLVEGYVYLRDCGSEYGIFAGDHQVTEEYMTQEREYAIGSCRLMLAYTEEAAPAATQPVRRVAKLKPKAVSSAAPAAATEVPATETPARRVAKLKPKAVVATAPVAQEPVYTEPQPAYYEEPQAVVEETVYAEPQPIYYEEPQPEVEPITYEEAQTVTEEPVYAEPQQVEEAPIAEEPQQVDEPPASAEDTPDRATTPAEENAPLPEPAQEVAAAPVTTDKATNDKPVTQTKGNTTQAQKGGKKKPAVTVKKAAPRTAPGVVYPAEPRRTGALAQLPTDFSLKLRLVNKENPLKVDTALRFALTAERACYVYLVQYDCEGNAGLLVPGMAGISNHMKAGSEAQFPNLGSNEYRLMVEPPTGQETIVALACSSPCNLDEVWLKLVEGANAPLTPGAMELQAIQACSAPAESWASAIINIRTVD